MTESRFVELRSSVLSLMEENLEPNLTYHNLAHTEDVMEQVERIAIGEQVADQNDILLLKVAALFHDTGFLETYNNHEEKSVEIMKRHLVEGDLTNLEIERVMGMIMATKIPQSPTNPLEEIICDADVDYLGRDDFERISNSLKDEFLVYGVIKSEADWNPLQIRFFEMHAYFTETCKTNRAANKKLHLDQLKANQSQI